jgi:hypothetical protein
MSDGNLTPPTAPEKITPMRCWLGAVIAGGIGYFVYLLTQAIATSFARTPVTSDNLIVLRITAAVRTLVLGVASLGTFVFAFVALGLLLLGMQLTWKSLTSRD